MMKEKILPKTLVCHNFNQATGACIILGAPHADINVELFHRGKPFNLCSYRDATWTGNISPDNATNQTYCPDFKNGKSITTQKLRPIEVLCKFLSQEI